jgi:hypothetical protein
LIIIIKKISSANNFSKEEQNSWFDRINVNEGELTDLDWLWNLVRGLSRWAYFGYRLLHSLNHPFAFIVSSLWNLNYCCIQSVLLFWDFNYCIWKCFYFHLVFWILSWMEKDLVPEKIRGFL